MDVIPEARLNLVIYYLRQDDVNEAYSLIKDLARKKNHFALMFIFKDKITRVLCIYMRGTRTVQIYIAKWMFDIEKASESGA